MGPDASVISMVLHPFQHLKGQNCFGLDDLTIIVFLLSGLHQTHVAVGLSPHDVAGLRPQPGYAPLPCTEGAFDVYG